MVLELINRVARGDLTARCAVETKATLSG